MKNKTKRMKIREKNTDKNAEKNIGKKSPKAPSQWIYLAKEEVDLKELPSLFGEEVKTEVWLDAGIAEIPLAEASSMDMERGAVDLGNEEDNAFLAQNETKDLFFVTIKPEDFALAKEAMNKIKQKWGGIFCADTDDFTPAV